MLSNLRNLGMAAEDGPWFSGRSVLLGSMLRPPRQRRWPHRGRSLLLANPPRTAPWGQSSGRGRPARYPLLCESLPVDREWVFAAAADERRQIADLVAELDEAQLAEPRLCTG